MLMKAQLSEETTTNMAPSLREKPFFQELEAEHRKWLLGFDQQYLRNWEKLLNSNEEAALAEGGVRRRLQGYGITVEPNEDLTGTKRSPDFRCLAGDYRFYVEVTNIAIDTATNTTGIADKADHEVRSFRSLNHAIFRKCVDKAAQCADLNAPLLVVVTTFHGFVAMANFNRQLPFMSWLLTGETKMSRLIDIRTGEQVGDTCSITSLQHIPFLDPKKDNWLARRSISGLLVCAPAMNDLLVLGILHPKPVRPFDATILPQIEFGQVVIDQVSGQLRVDWP
jgi:hypothetical protein